MSNSDAPKQNVEEIIKRFGGIRPMSNITNIPVSTIQGWKKRGRIPQGRLPEITSIAQKENIELPSLNVEQDNNREISNNDLKNSVAETVSQNESRPSASSIKSQDVPRAAQTINQEIPTQDIQIELTESEMNMKIAKAETRAVTKSTIISLIITLIMAVVAGYLLLSESKDIQGQIQGSQQNLSTIETNLDAIGQNVQELEKNVEAVKKEQSYFSNIVPQDWQNQIENLQTQATDLQQQGLEIKEQLEGALQQAQTITNDVIGENAGDIEQRLMKLEKHVGTLVGDAKVSALFDRMEILQTSLPGQELLGQTQNQLGALLSSFDGAPEELSGYLDSARQSNEALGQTFESVPAEDMKAAALLFGLNQFRAALSRDKQPFDQDLEILRKLVGAQDNAVLNEALTKLAPHGESGVLTVEGLSKEFRSIAGDVVVSSLSGEDVSIQEKTKARFNELFSVEKNGELLTGNESQNTVSRTLKFLEDNELEKAIAEAKTLEGPEAEVVEPWLKDAQSTLDVKEVKSVLNNILSEEGIRQLMKGNLSGQATMIHDPESGLRVYVP